MGLFDCIKRKVRGVAESIKRKQYEKKAKEEILVKLPMSSLEGICRRRGKSLYVKGKNGFRRARSKRELTQKLADLELDKIVSIAERHGVNCDKILAKYGFKELKTKRCSKRK